MIELLVSVALIALVVTIATTGFFQMLATTQRLQAQLDLDSAAETAYAKLVREADAMHPCAAVWLRSDRTAGEVELVFMKGKEQPYDFPNVMRGTPPGYTDLVWTRWYWSVASRELSVSESRSARRFRIRASQTRDYWKIPGGSRMEANGTPYYSTFLSVPQPRREVGTASNPVGAAAVLDQNAWDSGEPGDVGDHQDLVLNARPVLHECSDLTIEILSVDGGTHRADGSVDLDWGSPGAYVDGRGYSAASERPSVIRIRFTLTDRKTGTANAYSFSVSTPSHHPG